MNDKTLLGVDDLLALPAAEADATLAYGAHPEHFGQLYLPATGEAHPVVVLLHGGCWRAQVSLSYFGQAARALTHLGIAVWNIEYRRLGGGGGWPDTFLDVGKATDYLRSLAARYPLDLTRVISMGHSAGGHLAHWLASRTHLTSDNDLYTAQPLSLRGVVSIAGIPDIKAARDFSICQEAPEALMGGTPQTHPKRYVQGSPSALPALNIPLVFIQGEQDDIVPLAYVEACVNKATQRGEAVSLVTLAHTGHFEPVMAHCDQWASIEAAACNLLDLPYNTA